MCFLGQRCIILPGTRIGDNVIIGAGAVVHGNIPNNTVWAGNPAKMICTLFEYKEKREKKYEEGAVILPKQIMDCYNRKPTYQEMRMYIGLFLPRNECNRKYFDRLPSKLPNVSENVWKTEPKYSGLDEFLEKNNLYLK